MRQHQVISRTFSRLGFGFHKIGAVMHMDPCTASAIITALANALACRLDDDSLGLLSAQLVQLGDTLDTIAAQRSLCASRCWASESIPNAHTRNG